MPAAPPLVAVVGERLILPGDAPTIWHARPWGGHLVRLVAASARPRARQLAASPDLAPAATWAATPLRVRLGGAARVEGVIARAGATTARRGALAIAAPPGAYAVDVIPRWEHEGAVYQILRLRPVDAPAPAARHGATARAADARPVDATPVVEVTAAARRRARGLLFVATDGGPLLVLPGAAAARWHGAFDARGRAVYEQAPCDYDRAIAGRRDAPFALAIGGHRGLVLPGPAPTAWLRPAAPRGAGARDAGAMTDALLLIRHHGADSPAALIAAALAVPAAAWRATRASLELPAGELRLVDAAADAARARRDPRAIVRVAAGRYAIDTAAARVRARDGARTGDVAVELVRLRRRAGRG